MDRINQAIGMIAVAFVVLFVTALVLYFTMDPAQIETTGGMFQPKSLINQTTPP